MVNRIIKQSRNLTQDYLTMLENHCQSISIDMSFFLEKQFGLFVIKPNSIAIFLFLIKGDYSLVI